jgi:hypothetical protein
VWPSSTDRPLGAVQAVHLNSAKTTLFEGNNQATSATADFANVTGIV